MLSILHPEVMPSIIGLPCGFLPLDVTNDGKPILAIKLPKEYLLAAKSNLGFKIYVAPIIADDQRTVGLVSAFFDDEDEPLVLRTQLPDDAGIYKLRKMLLHSELDVYFFDDNNREFLAYQAELHCPSTTRTRFENALLLPLKLDPTELGAFDDQLRRWFGTRSQEEDDLAIKVSFKLALVPDDIFVMDLNPQNHAYNGAPAFSHSELIREHPGGFQERDIAGLLHRIFLPEQIYLNPLKVTDGKEITDILVISDRNALFIQAKDSPNTELVMRNPLQRKRTAAQKALTKALSQTRGALRYARSMTPMKIVVANETFDIDLEQLEIRALVIVKELFNDEYASYTPPFISLLDETGVACIPLDYSEFVAYTTHLEDEAQFFDAFDRVFAHGLSTKMFPRLRLWPNEMLESESQ